MREVQCILAHYINILLQFCKFWLRCTVLLHSLVQKVALYCTLVKTRTTRNYTEIQYDAVRNHIVILHCTVKTNNGCKKICILISDPILHKHVTQPIIYIFTLQKQTGGKGEGPRLLPTFVDTNAKLCHEG